MSIDISKHMLIIANIAMENSVTYTLADLMEVEIKARNIVNGVPGAKELLTKSIGGGMTVYEAEVTVQAAPKTLFLTEMTLNLMNKIH